MSSDLTEFATHVLTVARERLRWSRVDPSLTQAELDKRTFLLSQIENGQPSGSDYPGYKDPRTQIHLAPRAVFGISLLAVCMELELNPEGLPLFVPTPGGRAQDWYPQPIEGEGR